MSELSHLDQLRQRQSTLSEEVLLLVKNRLCYILSEKTAQLCYI